MISAANPVADVSFDLLCVAADPNPTGAGTRMDGGRVCFDNQGYQVTAADDGSVRVDNKRTGEVYLAWGPPQLWVDGEHAFSFYGTTTLELVDGTKITITTVPWADDPLVTVSDKVTITNAHYGVEILGLAVPGTLHFLETLQYGWLLDAVVADGNTVVENAAGAGFVGDAVDGAWQVVDVAYIQATDLAVLGPLAGERGRAFQTLTGLLAITFCGRWNGPPAYQADVDRESGRTRDDPAAPAERLRLRLQTDGVRVQWQVPSGRWGAP